MNGDLWPIGRYNAEHETDHLADAHNPGSPWPIRHISSEAAAGRSDGEAKDMAWCSDIQEATLRSFEVAAATCVPGDAAQCEDNSIVGCDAIFKPPNGAVFLLIYPRAAASVALSTTTTRPLRESEKPVSATLHLGRCRGGHS